VPSQNRSSAFTPAPGSAAAAAPAKEVTAPPAKENKTVELEPAKPSSISHRPITIAHPGVPRRRSRIRAHAKFGRPYQCPVVCRTGRRGFWRIGRQQESPDRSGGCCGSGCARLPWLWETEQVQHNAGSAGRKHSRELGAAAPSTSTAGRASSHNPDGRSQNGCSDNARLSRRPTLAILQ